MKTLMFDGHVGKNGTVVKSTSTGKKYASFSVANKSFANGEEKVEWFDVVSYDPIFIEKRAQYLSKGSYVIISGSLKTEVRPDQTGKLWVNHYVTAATIDTPRVGNKSSDQSTQAGTTTETTPIVSVFTAGTPNSINIPAQVTATPQPQVQVSVAGASNNVGSVDEVDDLPF